MSINKGLFFLLAVLLILPLSGLALAADPELNGGPVAGADAEADAEVSDTMPCQQVVDLENEFMVQRLQLLQEIESESDPLERENLQAEMHKLKFLEEVTIKALYLEIAVAKGDNERAAELQEALESLSEVGSHRPPATAEPAQDSDDDTFDPAVAPMNLPKNSLKNPDDA